MALTTTSADGTSIAYDLVGSGPALIVIGGAMNHRMSPYPLVEMLAPALSVYSYDRRGRGDSGDTAPYAVDREIEDLAAVIEAAGGSAMVYGHSSGAILALDAAMAGLPITRLAVYEPPYTTDPLDPKPSGDGGVAAALEAGDRSAATAAFMRLTGMDDGAIAWMQSAPFWPSLTALAHTLPYDLALNGDGIVPVERLADIRVPVLALDGGTSPEWAGRVAAAVASAVFHGTHETLDGQNHQVDQVVLAPVLAEFFTG